jgi:hypothetical protein
VSEPGFWTGAFDRALKSFAQALLLLWGADGFNLFEVDLLPALGVASGALILSLLTSIVSGPVGDDGTTSLLRGGR